MSHNYTVYVCAQCGMFDSTCVCYSRYDGQPPMFRTSTYDQPPPLFTPSMQPRPRGAEWRPYIPPTSTGPLRDSPAFADNPQSHSTRKKRKAPSDSTGTASTSKRPRKSRASKENDHPGLTVPGVGPMHNSEHLTDAPLPYQPRSSYTTSRETHQDLKESSQVASDVWWFLRCVDSLEKPSEEPPPINDKERSRTRLKGDFMACTLCSL